MNEPLIAELRGNFERVKIVRKKLLDRRDGKYEVTILDSSNTQRTVTNFDLIYPNDRQFIEEMKQLEKENRHETSARYKMYLRYLKEQRKYTDEFLRIMGLFQVQEEFILIPLEEGEAECRLA